MYCPGSEVRPSRGLDFAALHLATSTRARVTASHHVQKPSFVRSLVFERGEGFVVVTWRAHLSLRQRQNPFRFPRECASLAECLRRYSHQHESRAGHCLPDTTHSHYFSYHHHFHFLCVNQHRRFLHLRIPSRRHRHLQGHDELSRLCDYSYDHDYCRCSPLTIGHSDSFDRTLC